MSSIKHIVYIIAHVPGLYDQYVLHREFIHDFGGIQKEPNYLQHKTLSEYRKLMKELNRTCEERSMGDDPLIVERWI